MIEQPVDNDIFRYIFGRYEVKITIEEEAKKYKQKILTEQYGFEDGPVAARKKELDDPKENTALIKKLARELKADMVGISKVKKGYLFKGRELEHKYAISIALEMDYDRIQASPGPASATEVIRVYCVLGEITIKIASNIRKLGYQAYAHHPRGSTKFPSRILHIPTAIEAGFGELGRHGLLITAKYGPRVRLGTVTTNLPLTPNSPITFGAAKICEECNICVNECEGDAIPEHRSLVRGVKKYVVDPYKCGPYFGEYDGCSVCMKVCAFNKAPK
ncbi:MAG: reductive dehalogenase domain-containing protein [Thermoplasmata archaeon]